ncbi:tail length tape measure protein [Proteus mirabilis]|uniref:Tail length tape measure protein n=1 Tax=Proteus mirabilis TaxID=584 RepID=A0A379FG87_PROMI|nr:tail length tape measure protein [Proteus mirabilis]
MAGALGRLNIDLTLNTANFINAINRSQRQTEQFGQSIRVSLQAITVQQERMVSQNCKILGTLYPFCERRSKCIICTASD